MIFLQLQVFTWATVSSTSFGLSSHLSLLPNNSCGFIMLNLIALLGKYEHYPTSILNIFEVCKKLLLAPTLAAYVSIYTCNISKPLFGFLIIHNCWCNRRAYQASVVKRTLCHQTIIDERAVNHILNGFRFTWPTSFDAWGAGYGCLGALPQSCYIECLICVLYIDHLQFTVVSVDAPLGFWVH